MSRCCATCPQNSHCRVPGDMVRFHRVFHRLAQQERESALCERLDYFLNQPDCLVEAGYVKQ